MLRGLREAREDAGLSRKQVCEQMEIHYNTIKNWELGVTEPKGTELVALASMYGCSVESLMGLSEIPESKSVAGDAA